MPTNIHYVYILSRENGTPFYVGLGKGKRMYQHEYDCLYRNPESHKNRIIREMKSRGVVVPKRKIAEGLSRTDAIALEIATIAEIGREPNGPLVNATSGGEGLHDVSPEVRAIISAKVSIALQGNSYRTGIPHTAETKAKVSASLKGRPRPENVKHMTGNTYGNLNKGKLKSPETRAKMKESAMRRAAEGRHHIKKGHILSPETKAKIVASLTLRNKSPESRAKMSAAMKGRIFSPETLAKMKDGQAARREREAAAKLA